MWSLLRRSPQSFSCRNCNRREEDRLQRAPLTSTVTRRQAIGLEAPQHTRARRRPPAVAALANPIPAILKRNCSMELVAQILAGSGAKNLVYNLEATAASLSSSSGSRSSSQHPPHRRITMLIYSYQSVYMVVAFSLHHCSIFVLVLLSYTSTHCSICRL